MCRVWVENDFIFEFSCFHVKAGIWGTNAYTLLCVPRPKIHKPVGSVYCYRFFDNGNASDKRFIRCVGQYVYHTRSVLARSLMGHILLNARTPPWTHLCSPLLLLGIRRKIDTLAAHIHSLSCCLIDPSASARAFVLPAVACSSAYAPPYHQHCSCHSSVVVSIAPQTRKDVVRWTRHACEQAASCQ